jgi:DNA-binding XRE family transcriptional regulator
MKTLQDIKRELLASPAALAAYEAQAPEFDMARELIAARSRAGLTQSDVAQRMGTTQSVIARLEGGKGTPSMRTVQRYAQAVGARAVVRIEPQAAPGALRVVAG